MRISLRKKKSLGDAPPRAGHLGVVRGLKGVFFGYRRCRLTTALLLAGDSRLKASNGVSSPPRGLGPESEVG